jgi:quinol monooxygenase YgiN
MHFQSIPAPTRPWKKRTHLSLLMFTATFLACTHGRNLNHKTSSSDAIANIKEETFQELGFFGAVRRDNWPSFLEAVQNNIANSRQEAGNLSFHLYSPQNGDLKPIWFERFKNKTAHTYHKEQQYFKDAIKVIQASLESEATSITLKEISELPPTATSIDTIKKTLHVITLLHVKGEKRKVFIGAIKELALHSKQATANMVFTIYEYAEEPNKFVLIEDYKSSYRYQDKPDPIREMFAAGYFVSDPTVNRWVVNDISQ